MQIHFQQMKMPNTSVSFVISIYPILFCRECTWYSGTGPRFSLPGASEVILSDMGRKPWINQNNYSGAIMSPMASQITGFTSIYSTVCSGLDQRKHQSSALLAFVRGIHRWPMNSSHKGPVTRKMFPFDDVIMGSCRYRQIVQTYDCAVWQGHW